ncbi:DNA topoisomerase IB [soil metagenome]
MPDGSAVSDRRREAIRVLAIPPAWTDVWICTDGRGHLQATGRDVRGRKQYRYHANWRVVRDENKFDRLLEFGLALPDLRAAVDEDLRRPGLPHDKVVALAVGLLDRTLIRVGNEQYRDTNGTYGLTTMEDDHVEIHGGDLSFSFIGKGGQEHQVDLHEPLLAKAVRRCHELGGRELFTYKGEDGSPVRIDSADCNEYVATHAGEGATVKYFRTWGATVTVMEELAAVDPGGAGGDSSVLAAIDVAADRLGNTRAVCRRAYVHPGVVEVFHDGTLTDLWSSSRSTASMSRGERATLKLLEQLREQATD